MRVRIGRGRVRRVGLGRVLGETRRVVEGEEGC